MMVKGLDSSVLPSLCALDEKLDVDVSMTAQLMVHVHSVH